MDISDIVPGNTIQTEKTDFGSTYSEQQQKINRRYKAESNDRYVLFVTSKTASGGQNGYFRLNGQFGYIFGNAKDKTPAHEVGHGVFKLEHPWSAYGTKEGKTNLLMDKNSGEIISHLEWKQINDPKLKLYAFQKKKEGEDINKKFILKEDSYFITPSNKLIKLTKGTEIIFFCNPPQNYQNNVLHGFKTPDGFYWYNTTEYGLNIKEFKGFYKVSKNNEWVLDASKNNIRYSDSNFKYHSNAKYPVYFIQGANIDDNNYEYRIYKGEINATPAQISVNAYFSGKIKNVQLPKNAKQEDIITSTRCLESIQDKENTDQAIIDPQGKYEMYFTKNKNGIIQVKSFEFNKDIDVVKGKKANLNLLAQEITNKTNQFLKDHNVKDLNTIYSTQSETFADGRKIEINGSYAKVISEGLGITTTLLKTGEVEKKVYLDQSDATIKAPGLVTGSVEAGVMAATDITSTVVMIYDLATDETARKETYEGLVKIKDEVKENPSGLFPILADVILEEATGLSADDWQKTQAQQTGKGEKSHLYSKGAVRSTITAVASGSLITKLPKMADDLVVKMKKAKVKKLIPSLKRFDVAGEFAKGKKLVEQTIKWGENQITLKWKRVGNKIDFGNRSDLATILGTTDNIEAHHILPWKICENEEIVRLAALDGFHPNMIENGLGLEKYTKLVGNGMHGNHPAYNTFVKNKLRNQMLEKPNITPEQANKFLQEELIPELKTHIIKAQNSDMNLNEYFKQLN